MLIDFSTPASELHGAREDSSVTGRDALAGSFSLIDHENGSDPAQQAAELCLDETEKKRQADKRAAIERRDARRKSLANRRVSFAPEATLHTWSVMELVEDSTTSSASNSTRRQSSMTAAQSPKSGTVEHQNSISAMQRTAVTTESVPKDLSQQSPRPQRQPHREDSERTLDSIPTSDDEIPSSPGDGRDSSPMRIEDGVDSESDTDGDTAMSLEESTINTVRSSDSSSTQTSLDDRLRQAASQAGTRGIEYDENLEADEGEDDGDQIMDLADATITHAFKSSTKAPQQVAADLDKENVDPHVTRTQLYGPSASASTADATSDKTMDMTQAAGKIISFQRSTGRRRSSIGENYAENDTVSFDDESMDLTTAKGGILQDNQFSEEEAASDEEVTMEFTNVIGMSEIRSKKDLTLCSASNETEAMDVTVAAGGILAVIEEQTEPPSMIEEDATCAMDMTRAMGQIMSHNTHAANNTADPTPQTAEVPSLTTGEQSEHLHIGASMATVASETGSPSLKPRLSGRKSVASSTSATPRSPTRAAHVATDQGTPSKQLTPVPIRGPSPKRTPVLTNVTQRSASPKKLFKAELKQRASPASRIDLRHQHGSLFAKDKITGLETPRIVLHASKPHQHISRASGSRGPKTEILGSPKVSELLARRSSLGEASTDFKLGAGQRSTLRFADPKQLELEIDLERAEEHRRESGRMVMELEADENNTQQLRNMISSMSPKKDKPNKTRGRKSLAIGSAKGLLGKRPAELDVDEDDDEDDEHTPKRLKTVSRESSPVKRVHLPRPPSKEQTTGRLSRTQQLALNQVQNETPTTGNSPVQTPMSPDVTGKFKSATSDAKLSLFDDKLDNVMNAVDIGVVRPELAENGAEEEKTSLQQFLNMTNIHFIELSHTKRRHTIAPPAEGSHAKAYDNTSAAPFVAAATTLPLLELYQHATQELKAYISSGRKIVRSIEAETLADQPALFQEYINATVEEKHALEDRFRNSKTNARLQSKEGWYLWRSQLVDGLRDGLSEMQETLKNDRIVLTKQQESMNSILQSLVDKKSSLKEQTSQLRARLRDRESGSHETLKLARQQLLSADDLVKQNGQHLASIQSRLREKEAALAQAAELRAEMVEQIREAQRVQEARRAVPSQEIATLHKEVERLENEHGWSLVAVIPDPDDDSSVGTELTLAYKHSLCLKFHPSAFQLKSAHGRRRSGRKSRSVSGPNPPLTLTYVPPEEEEEQTIEHSVGHSFMMRVMQGQLQNYSMLPKGTIAYRQLLKTVSEGWKLADEIKAEIEQLAAAGIVRTTDTDDGRLCSKLVLVQAGRSRIDMEFQLGISLLNDGEYVVSTSVNASPVYGEVVRILDSSRVRKVQTALAREVGSKKFGQGAWISAVRGFEQWLTAQARASAAPRSKKSRTVSPSRTTAHATSPAQVLPAPPLPAPTRATAETSSSPPRERVRAVTQSPHHHLQTPAARRSPLAPKTTNRLMKKAIPVPTAAAKKVNTQLFPTTSTAVDSTVQKENVVPAGYLPLSTKVAEYNSSLVVKSSSNHINRGGDARTNTNENDDDDVFSATGGTKPAIPPEIQEQMMITGTPMKRRLGALRRSPM